MTVRTRPATEADYAVAGNICYEAYRADGQLDGDRGYGRVLADVAARAPVTEVIVADDPSTGELLGCVTFVLAGRPWAEIAHEGEGEFRMLAVAPGAQGRGVGSALVRACLERAVALRCTAGAGYQAARDAATTAATGVGCVFQSAWTDGRRCVFKSAWTDGRRCVFKSAWTDGRRCVFKSAWTDGRRIVEAAVKRGWSRRTATVS